MGYAILWVTHLAFVLLLVASMCALASNEKKLPCPRFWPMLFAFLGFFSGLIFLSAGTWLLKENLQPKWLFPYGLSLTILLVAGLIPILRFGLKDVKSEKPASRSWPLLKLLLSTGISLVLYIITLNILETRIRIQLNSVDIKASADLVHLLPKRLPASLDASILYEEAGRIYNPSKETKTMLFDSRAPDFDVTRHEVEALLDNYHDAMQLFEKAVRLPGYTPFLGSSDFWKMIIPNLSPYQGLSRLFILSARRKALTNDPNGAFEDLNVVEKMSNHFREFPTLISVLFGLAIDRDRILGLEYVLAHTSYSKINNIQIPLKPRPSVFKELLRAYQVEYTGLLQEFPRAATDNTSKPVAFGTPLWRVFLLPSDLNGAIKITALMTERMESYEDLEHNVKKIDEAYHAGEFGVFTGMSVPNHWGYAERVKQSDARYGLTTLALAVTAYANRTGQYPSQLATLVPDYLTEIPSDPFDPGNPLKMKLVNGGVDLFSIGPEESSHSDDSGPIHFYLGLEAYEEFRIKPSKNKAKKGSET